MTSFCPALSITTKHASNLSIDQGRREAAGRHLRNDMRI
jgi:hypothetical protein